MSIVSFKEQINEIYSTTSKVFAEQEAKNYEEEVNDFLDFVREVSNSLNKINNEFGKVLDSFSLEIAQTNTIKDLILLRETVIPLFTISKKLFKTIHSKNDYRIALKTDLEPFQDNIKDLNEMLIDIEKRLTKNKSIENLLNDISKLIA